MIRFALLLYPDLGLVSPYRQGRWEIRHQERCYRICMHGDMHGQ